MAEWLKAPVLKTGVLLWYHGFESHFICINLNMYLSLIFLSLIGSLNTLFFGRFIGVKGSSIITISCIALTVVFSYASLYEVGCTVEDVHFGYMVNGPTGPTGEQGLPAVGGSGSVRCPVGHSLQSLS